MTTLASEFLGARVAHRVPSSGASGIAVRLRDKIARFGQDAAWSALDEVRRYTPIARLLEGFRESLALAEHGDIVAPSDEALREALVLISSLPAWVPPPTPLIEHDGTIALEWDVGEKRFFVVAVDGTGRAEYSAILGVEGEHYGTTNFTGALPPEAQILLARLLRQ